MIAAPAFTMAEELRILESLTAISKRKHGSKALEILNIISFLAPENIPTSLLVSLVREKKQLKAPIQLLIQHSLVSYAQNDTVINMNTTAQIMMLVILENPHKKIPVLLKVLKILSSIELNASNIDHYISVWGFLSPYPKLVEYFSKIPNCVLNELHDQKRYDEAHKFSREALDVMNRTLGEDHRSALGLHFLMGLLISEEGNHEQSLKVLQELHEKNVKYSEKEGIWDTLLLITRELCELNRHDEALDIYKNQVFKGRRVSEAKNDKTLFTWYEYADRLGDTCHFSEAEEILKEILKRRNELMPSLSHDPHTMFVKTRLAEVLVKQSKYSEAVLLYQQLLAYKIVTLGENHIDTLSMKLDMADILQKQESEEALSWYEEVLESYRQILGEEDRKTLRVQATIFENSKDYDKAMDIYRHIYKKSVETLGETDIKSLKAKHDVARVLALQKRITEALEAFQKVTEGYNKVLGPQDPMSVEAMESLTVLTILKFEPILSAVKEGKLDKIKSLIESGVDVNGELDSKKTPLHYAAAHNHEDVVKFLLQKGAIYNHKDKDGKTPWQVTDNVDIKNLLSLVENFIKDVKEGNDVKTCEHIAKNNVILNAKDNDGSNSLHWAAHNGHEDIVRLLLDSGADATQVTYKGNTPLHIATSKGRKEIVKVLLQHVKSEDLDSFINARTFSGGVTAIHVAAKNGFFDIVKSLMKHGAIYNVKNTKGKTPLEVAKDRDVTTLLKLSGELFEDAKNGNPDIVTKLQAVKPDELEALTSARNHLSNTILQVTVANKHDDIANRLSALHKKPTEIVKESSSEWTLDQLEKLKAAAEKHLEFAGLHLRCLRSTTKTGSGCEKNPSPWATLKEGSYYLETVHPLIELYKCFTHGSINDKNIQAINDTLLELGFDPSHITLGYTEEAYNAKTKSFVSKGQGTKYYKLLYSNSKKDIRMFLSIVDSNIEVPVRWFLDSIDTKLQSVRDENLLKAVENNNHSESENCIKDGVNLNLKNTKGETPLHIATMKDFTEIIEVLLQNVSYDNSNDFVNAQTVEGTSSLHIAAKNGSLEAVKLLFKYGAIFDLKNNAGKTPLDLATDQDIIDLLKLTKKLFQHATEGNNCEIINELEQSDPEMFTTLTNVRDNENHMLLEIATVQKYKKEVELMERMEDSNKFQAWLRPKAKNDELRILETTAELHVRCSKLNFLKLRSLSESHISEQNPLPRETLMDGVCYLGSAHNLVGIYNEMHCPVGSKDIQKVNRMLEKLDFDVDRVPGDLKSSDYGENSPMYFKLLKSDLKKDLRLFLEMVEHNIEAPIARFLDAIKQKLQSLGPDKIFAAIKNNDRAEFDRRIQGGVDVNAKNTDGRTPLHYAVDIGNLEMVNVLLKNKADVTQTTSQGHTPLHIAAVKDSTEIAEALLQHMSHDKSNDFINAQTLDGSTSLHLAARSGNSDMVKFLLKRGAIYNIHNDQGKTPLSLCIHHESDDLLRLISSIFEEAKYDDTRVLSKLQDTDPDEFTAITNTRNNEGKTLLQVVITNKHQTIAGKLIEIIKNPNHILSRHKWKLDEIKKVKEAAESYVVSSESYLRMLRNTSQPNRSEKNSFPWATLKAGSHYLQNAHNLVEEYKGCVSGDIENENIQVVNDTLVELEFDPKHITLGYTDEAYDGKVECFVSKGQGTKYYELLHSELKKDIRSFIEIVEPKIDVNVRTFSESMKQKSRSIILQKLFDAIDDNNNSEVKKYCEDKEVLNMRADRYGTPLGYAVVMGNVAIINTLLKNGADVTIPDDEDGETPLIIASYGGSKRICEMLVQHVDREKLYDYVNAKMASGETALHFLASDDGFLDSVKYLLKHGAIYNTKNNVGETPLDYSQNENIDKLLESIQVLFDGAINGNSKIISKLKTSKLDDLAAFTNTRNDQNQSLIQVALSNGHKDLAAKIDTVIKTRLKSNGGKTSH